MSSDGSQCQLSPGQRRAALIINILTEGVVLYDMNGFFEQTVTANSLMGTDPIEEVTPTDLSDYNLRSAIEKLVDAGTWTVLMAVFQEAMAPGGHRHERLPRRYNDVLPPRNV